MAKQHLIAIFILVPFDHSVVGKYEHPDLHEDTTFTNQDDIHFAMVGVSRFTQAPQE